jgi:hypothetical protein
VTEQLHAGAVEGGHQQRLVGELLLRLRRLKQLAENRVSKESDLTKRETGTLQEKPTLTCQGFQLGICPLMKSCGLQQKKKSLNRCTKWSCFPAPSVHPEPHVQSMRYCERGKSGVSKQANESQKNLTKTRRE